MSIIIVAVVNVQEVIAKLDVEEGEGQVDNGRAGRGGRVGVGEKPTACHVIVIVLW